ncbi:MAG: hypothetical protein KatS3mg022_2300 [Armatimonadota bacterium]|nr:MAG: hypothetical protein KatS3mg022_2300 [Armatimonadota bacterium]
MREINKYSDGGEDILKRCEACFHTGLTCIAHNKIAQSAKGG